MPAATEKRTEQGRHMSRFRFAELRQSTRVFCFLDLEHPAVAWAVMRGMLVSADYASSLKVTAMHIDCRSAPNAL
jgi:hypothetical protein